LVAVFSGGFAHLINSARPRLAEPPQPASMSPQAASSPDRSGTISPALQGSGTRAADAAGLSPAPPTATWSSTALRQARYDLRAGSPDLSAFARAGWLSAARRALSAAPSQALGYGDPPGLRLTGIAVGLHAVVELPRGRSEHQVVARAATRGVAIERLGDYALRDHTRGPALVIGYTAPPGHAYSTVLAGSPRPSKTSKSGMAHVFAAGLDLSMDRLPPSVGLMTANENGTTAVPAPQVPVRLDLDAHAAGFACAGPSPRT
jgi:DNA-binding transcriptional MocR family regulator